MAAKWTYSQSHRRSESARKDGVRADAVQQELQRAQSIGLGQMLFALLAAPLAWSIQVAVATAADAHCPAGASVFVFSPLQGTGMTLAAASFICLMLALAGATVAWRSLRLTARMTWWPVVQTRGTRGERDWFLARVCALFSVMFTVGVVATQFSVLVGAGCSVW
ncbi:hypothetical protein [Paraburkholderia sp.]|uniref:hypothetical protein n=1 Tax=Paraburkholderia sp. TaxID=1926495 RepID=UPI002387C7EE|nr:hypothetical protein [Paraburkholderia sp.]MDE1181644.1 hypothetical protein [Paraburkholderia sp.]